MLLVPIDKLSIKEIADFWASEIASGDIKMRDRREVYFLNLLAGAWWLGEVIGFTDRDRLSTLAEIGRRVCDEGGTGRQLLLRTSDDDKLAVPLPDTDPDSWTAEACIPAFTTIAESWGRLRLDPIWQGISSAMDAACFVTQFKKTESIVLSRDEFLEWAKGKDFEIPYFWRRSPLNSKDRVLNARGRKPTKLNRVQDAMVADFESGSISKQDLSKLKEEALASRYGVSRETARKARANVLAKDKIVGN